MSEARKPREWSWTELAAADPRRFRGIHYIEKSAYDELLREYGKCSDYCDQLKERVAELEASPKVKLKHHCPEWDGALISPGDPEMDACICDFSPEHLWSRIGKLEARILQFEITIERRLKSDEACDHPFDEDLAELLKKE